MGTFALCLFCFCLRPDFTFPASPCRHTGIDIALGMFADVLAFVDVQVFAVMRVVVAYAPFGSVNHCSSCGQGVT